MRTQTIANITPAPANAAPMPTPALNATVSVVAFFRGLQLEVGGGFEPVYVAAGQLPVVVVDDFGVALVKLAELVSWADDGGTVAVLVRALPVTPIIVWAFPLSIGKVPAPVPQSQVPFATSGAQHQRLFPHGVNCPLSYGCWSSTPTH